MLGLSWFFSWFFLFTPSAHARRSGLNQSEPDLRDKTPQRCPGGKEIDDSSASHAKKKAQTGGNIEVKNHVYMSTQFPGTAQ